jgi:hypothetical protein
MVTLQRVGVSLCELICGIVQVVASRPADYMAFVYIYSVWGGLIDRVGCIEGILDSVACLGVAINITRVR